MFTGISGHLKNNLSQIFRFSCMTVGEFMDKAGDLQFLNKENISKVNILLRGNKT